MFTSTYLIFKTNKIKESLIEIKILQASLAKMKLINFYIINF